MCVSDIFTKVFFRNAFFPAIETLVNIIWISDDYCPCNAVIVFITNCFPTANKMLLQKKHTETNGIFELFCIISL